MSSLRGRLALAYHLRCAREDARIRKIVTPLGVWVCDHCRLVCLTQPAFTDHLSAVHS